MGASGVCQCCDDADRRERRPSTGTRASRQRAEGSGTGLAPMLAPNASSAAQCPSLTDAAAAEGIDLPKFAASRAKSLPSTLVSKLKSPVFQVWPPLPKLLASSAKSLPSTAPLKL